MTRNLTRALTSGAFVKVSESVAIIGDASDTNLLCASIAEACRNAGKSVYELNGVTEMVNVDFDSPAVVSDLLIVRELPQDGEHQVGIGTAWSASKALGAVLFRRAEISKSTLIASCENPRDWVKLNRLGPDTFWIAASLGIGLLLDAENPDHQKYLPGVHVPSHHRHQGVFEKYSVVPMDCVDAAWHAEFDRDMRRPDWHWIDCRAPE